MSADNKSYKKSSFGPAFFFLSKRRREALANYYEFCRLMDDIADEPDVPSPQRELDHWEKEILRLYEGAPQTDLGRRLEQDIRFFSIPSDRFLFLIEGMRADVEGKQYATEAELEWYLYRVAVVVGAATLDILGVQGPRAEELALLEGQAVQLTNIVRDVHDDARLGRVYIPQDVLQRFSLTRQDVLQNRKPQDLARALAYLAQRAEALYEQAFARMKDFPRLKMLPCRVMGYVYAANLAKIKKTGFVFSHTVKLTKGEKLARIAYALLKTFF